MKKAQVLIAFLGFILSNVTVLAEPSVDTYEAEILLTERSKMGLLVSVNNEIYGQLLIKRNQAEILRLPVFAKEKSIGVTAGFFMAGSGTFDALNIKGVSGSTKISDFMSAFQGTSKGAAVMIPGPCCLEFGYENLNATNSKGLSFEAKLKPAGIMVDFSRISFQIAANKTLNERLTVVDQSLAQLSVLPYQKESSKGALMDLECKEEQNGSSHFIAVNNFNEIKHFQVTLWPKDFYQAATSALRPTINGETLTLYPEKINSQVKGERFDIDLASESQIKKDFFGRELSYRGTMISATERVNLTCISAGSLTGNRAKFALYRQTFWKN